MAAICPIVVVVVDENTVIFIASYSIISDNYSISSDSGFCDLSVIGLCNYACDVCCYYSNLKLCLALQSQEGDVAMFKVIMYIHCVILHCGFPF